MTDRGYMLRARLNVIFGLERAIARALVDAAQIWLSSNATRNNIDVVSADSSPVGRMGLRSSKFILMLGR
jgi:hypothetical protein